jgi:His-Xaa-Ser system radical SAM maturase HxsB
VTGHLVSSPLISEDSPLELLPFRFHRLNESKILVTNMVGEHLVLSPDEFRQLAGLNFDEPGLAARLRGKHFIRLADESLPLELLAIKTFTRHRRLREFTMLHIFVVTLRCEHSCSYCQVSRQNEANHQFDMSPETAARSIEMAFRSPSRDIKIEFQGGEPLLHFDLVESMVADAQRRAEETSKSVSFVIATNLALLDERILKFAEANNVFFSTSLDGPPALHNANRPRPGNDSWERAVEGIRRVRETLGADRVDALMTTTQASLPRVREIVDSYVEQGLQSIFLRPISPYGFASRSKKQATYDAERWLSFYEEGLDYIVELNAAGTAVREQYASIVLRKMLTNDDPGYVDLMSPAGIGIGALVYNYDGDVYASDEGRMLAEMNDKTFRLGNVHKDSYEAIVTSDALLDPLEESFALSAPMCNDCAFEPFCGSDPVFHYTTAHDFLGRKAESAFCTRNMGVFKLLLDRYHSDSFTRSLFRSWARR